MHNNVNIEDRELPELKCRCGNIAPEWFDRPRWYDPKIGQYECNFCYSKRKGLISGD